jgi:hypothetical protein
MKHEPTAHPGVIRSPVTPRAHRFAVAWCCQISHTTIVSCDTSDGSHSSGYQGDDILVNGRTSTRSGGASSSTIR